MRRFISAKVFGISLPQEYVCVSLEDFEKPLSAYVTGCDESGHFGIHHQILLGYKPLIVGLSYEKLSEEGKWLHSQERVCISFVMKPFLGDLKWHGFTSDRDAVARLILRKIASKDLGDTVLFILEGQYGEHGFLAPFYQATNRLKEKLRTRKDDLRLPGNLYDQVRIGYATPRAIAMITVSDSSGSMNMFPTDLHGPVGSGYYAGSLRQGGKATQQVEQWGMITLSEVETHWYREAYSFGKNHMKDLSHPDGFPLSSVRSQENKLALPVSVVHYRELRRIDSLDLGIHKIHFYKTLHEGRVSDGHSLAHIHCFYAQWRNAQGLATDYLYR